MKHTLADIMRNKNKPCINSTNYNKELLFDKRIGLLLDAIIDTETRLAALSTNEHSLILTCENDDYFNWLAAEGFNILYCDDSYGRAWHCIDWREYIYDADDEDENNIGEDTADVIIYNARTKMIHDGNWRPDRVKEEKVRSRRRN